MPIQEKCRILDHQKVGPKHFKLTLASKYISTHAQPGQFVNVKCSDSYDPLLRRPLSLHRIAQEHERFELLYEIIGKGTKLLSEYSVGEELDVLGPLGKGFSIDQNKKVAMLVGGGMGIAPLLSIANNLKTKAIYVFIGAKTSTAVLCESDFKQITDQVLISTDDGSYGKKGLVSDILLNFIENDLGTLEFGRATIYACGPRAMLQALADISFQKQIDCQVSMEQHMACGIGTCLGCVIKTNAGYQKVCDEGPVFDAREILWKD